MSGLHFRRESSVVREVASLGTVAIVVLLFLAFLTTLRPIAIAAVQGDKVAAVQGDKVIDARANEAATLAHSLADGCTAGEPSQFFPCGCGKPNCL